MCKLRFLCADSGLDKEIDKNRLSLAASKFNRALTVFGDLDGFTAIVAAAMGDDDRLATLVRDFHIVRAELRHVAIADYKSTLRVQYQGDRIQLLRHLPHDDEGKRALRAIKIAAAWNSSLTQTLPEAIDVEEVALATGIADGPTLISKLGTRGNRDVVTVGPGARRAERIQRNLAGSEIGIDGDTHSLLCEDVQALFEWRPGAQAHVCSDKDINDIELALRGASYDAGEAQRVTITAGKVAVAAAAGTALVGAAAKAWARQDSNGNGSHSDDGPSGGEPDRRLHHGHRPGGGGNVFPNRRWAG